MAIRREKVSFRMEAPTPSTEAAKPAIVFVAVPSQLGGSNRSLATVMTAFEGRVRRVLAAPSQGAFREFARARGFSDVYLGLPAGNRWARIRASITLARLMRGWRDTIECVHAQALTGLNLAVPGAVLTGLPVVVRVSDPVGSRWGRILGPVIRVLVRDLRVVPVSDLAGAIAVENGLCRPDELHVIPNPVDPGEARAIKRIPGGSALRIGFLGGPSHRKGWDILLSVIESTLDLDVEWKLFVHHSNAGADLERAGFPEQQVQLMGRVTDVREAYAQCDAVFVPSRDESFCRVVVEAMVNGLPVVASDLPPIVEHLGDEEAGLMFPSGDATRAEEAIRRLVGDEALRRRLGAVGLEKSAAYEPSAIADRLSVVYGVSST